MKRYSTFFVLAACSLVIATGCHKDDLSESAMQEVQAEVVSYSPMVKDMAMVSGLATKGELINGGKDASGSKPLEELVASELKTFHFYVAAWDVKSATEKEEFIPAFDKVKYFTTLLNPDEKDSEKKVMRNMWATVNKDDDTQITERMWASERKSKTVSGVTKEFFAYANVPVGTTAEIAMDGSLPQSLDLTYTQPEEASAQKDVLAGYYKGNGQSSDKASGTAAISFMHPLASVQVTLGNLKGVNKLTVNSIRIEDVYQGGVCSIAPTSEGIDCEWTINKEEVSGKTVPVTTTVYQNDLALELTKDSTIGTNIGKPFIVIPQNFSTDAAKLIINVTADGKTMDLGWDLDPSMWKEGESHSTEWGNGVTYTYSLNYNGHAGVQLWPDGPYWATKNVGAKKVEDSGLYFSWGNVKGYALSNKSVHETIEEYGWTDYDCTWTWTDPETGKTETLEDGFTNSMYAINIQGPGCSLWKQDIPVNGTYDAARKQNGLKWRIPTKGELDGLLDPENTEITYTSRNNQAGFLITGVKTGYEDKSIFLPYYGFGYGSGDYNKQPMWTDSATLYASSGHVPTETKLAYYLYLTVYKESVNSVAEGSVKEDYRELGSLIRPVEDTTN